MNTISSVWGVWEPLPLCHGRKREMVNGRTYGQTINMFNDIFYGHGYLGGWGFPPLKQ